MIKETAPPVFTRGRLSLDGAGGSSTQPLPLQNEKNIKL